MAKGGRDAFEWRQRTTPLDAHTRTPSRDLSRRAGPDHVTREAVELLAQMIGQAVVIAVQELTQRRAH